ncbi:MAG: hypothetical protein E2O39_01130 [Planctomycetota bacterium]|nr:MAG: hypothetical protein E2O39_01130 [Planctomycetota bacterium]
MSGPLTRRAGRFAAWLAVVALLVPWWADAEGARAPTSIARRLLGPVASLAASAQWVRFDVALRDGAHERAYAIAETALALDPGAHQGWYALGRHLVFDRASKESEPEPAERRRWIRAGLDVLQRGERFARDPGELAFLGAQILYYVAVIPDVELRWPGGPAAALESAVAAFDRAAALGHPLGAESADTARADLATRVELAK